MLRPKDLATKDYPMAVKPSLGYEQQLHISTQNYTGLGDFVVGGTNSGILSLSTPDTQTLLGAPQELLAVLDTDVPPVAGQLVLTITGTNQQDVSKTWTATIKTPAYAQSSASDFPRGLAAEIIPQVDGDTCKTITGVTVVCDSGWAGTKILILGMPSLSSFVKIGTKVKLDYDPKVPMPVAIQDGRDRGAFIKAGEIDVGTCDITVKEPTSADGLWRYRGKRVTGWIKEMKEDKLNTQNIFLGGLVMTPKVSVPEGAEPNTLAATGLFERFASVPAQ